MTQILNAADLASQVLKELDRSGVPGDLIVNEAETLSLRANQGQLEEHKVSSTRILGLRVFHQGRVGTAYSEATDETALTSLVAQALINARFSREDPDEQLADNQQSLTTDDADLCPDDSVSLDERMEMALRLESDLRARPDIRNVPHSGLMQTVSQQAVFSTAGLHATSRQRMNMAFAAALAESGERNAMESFGQAARTARELDIDGIVQAAWQRSVDMLAGEPVPSGSYDVIFDVECQSDLLDVFALAFSGKAARDGINPWRDKVGERLADPRLSLHDRPLDTSGLGYALFDAEGTATTTHPVLDNGVLVSLLHNSATARHFGVASTGHATRGPRSTLSVSPHQWAVAPGDISRPDLTAGDYLEITDLTGMHSGANALSGDFSLGASGFLCRNGERIKPVRGITVAGNFYRMLDQIAAIGDTPTWNWRRTASMPGIRFSGLAISG